MDSSILNLSIALSLRDALSGQLEDAIDRVNTMRGVTDDLKAKLGELGRITVGGGILAGAGIAGLNATINAIDTCVDRYSTLEDAMGVFQNKAFGKSLLDESQADHIQELTAEAQAVAMRIGENTTFDSPEIINSMTELVKGGMAVEDVYGGMAEANALFAQVNRVSAESTANGTVQMASGFNLAGDQIMQVMEYVNQYADATTADSLRIQQALGSVAGTASNIWASRDNADVAKETIALTAITTSVVGDENSAATYVRNFLDRANMSVDRMTEDQIAAMKKVGWMDSEGHSAFIDYQTGMLKDIYELERIIEDGKKGISDTDFSNVMKLVFQEQGVHVANALSQSGTIDLANVDMNAGNALSIYDQAEREMSLLNNIKDSYEEAKNNLMLTLGEPFSAPQKAFYNGLKDVLGGATEFFSEHPEVTKFAAALATGASAIATVAGGATMLIGAGSALRLMWGMAGPAMIASLAPVAGVMLPILGATTLLAGAGVLIYRNWDVVGPHVVSIGGKIGSILGFAAEKGGMLLDIILPIGGAFAVAFEEDVITIFCLGLDAVNLGLAVVDKGVHVIGDTFAFIWESGKNYLQMLLAACNGDTAQMEALIQQEIQNIKNYITSVFGDLPKRAFTWGTNLMDSFVGGIKERLNTIPDALKGAAETIKAWIGVESPTKEGPLSRNHLWGGNLITSLSSGMLANIGQLETATSRVASTMNLDTTWTAGRSKAASITRSQGTGNTIGNVTIQITAREGQNEERIAEMVMEKLRQLLDGDAPNPDTVFSPRGVYSY